MEYVRFMQGTKAEYLSLPSHNPLGLYFCDDTGELFKGDICLSDGMRMVSTYADLPLLSNAADGVIYFVIDSQSGYTISPDRTEWLQTIYAPNKQLTAEELKTLLGLGSAAYEDASAFDAAGAAGAVRTYVGDIPNDENGDPMAASVIAYINKKTDGIATSGNLETLANRVSATENDIDSLEAAVAAMQDEETGIAATLKDYVDEQVITGGSGTIDYGEI